MPPILQTKSIADKIPVNTDISRAAVVLVLGPMFLSTTLVLLADIAIMVVIAPKFAAATKEFDLKLSPMQAMFYTVADRVGGANGTFPLWPILVPAVVAGMFGLSIMIVSPRTRSIGRAVLFALFLFAAVSVVITIVSCFAPMAALMEHLAKDGASAI